jgi:N-dimethylarginine dimethylaminohydrolase
VAELLEVEVLSVQLVNEWFYHLDTCFCPLDSRSALWWPEAFDPYARKVIESRVEEPIAVSPESARRFACNAVVAGRNVVLNSGCPDVVEKLEERGFRVHQVELGEFIKAGGSARCLTLQLTP